MCRSAMSASPVNCFLTDFKRAIMSEERIINLEIKFSHQDDLINQLNRIVTEQQMRLERLEQEVRELREVTATSPAGERPPHY